ncbi:MAG: hypothetical protein FJ280_19790 [Planctomycetes bacterium]|nr:hypothetical protein [Planctomycetota bacterium]
MPQITRELALKIAKKLHAEIVERGGAHDIALVRHEGKLIAQFGIRRGSNKEAGHDHVPEQIFLRARQARLLGQCPLSREEWVKIVAEKGMI